MVKKQKAKEPTQPATRRDVSKSLAARLAHDKENFKSVVNHPKHYQGGSFIHDKYGRIELEAVHVLEAFAENNVHLSQALKYLLRAGKKMNSSYYQDIAKGMWWLVRSLKVGDKRDLVNEAIDQF